MTIQYYKCHRCGAFYAVTEESALSIGEYDVDLGNKVTLCKQCFQAFKVFIREGSIKNADKPAKLS